MKGAPGSAVWAPPACWYESVPYEEALEWARQFRRHWQQRSRDEKGTGKLHPIRYFDGAPTTSRRWRRTGHFYFSSWNPDRVGSAEQKVNFPTWAWPDSGDMGEVSVTARPAELDWEVTVTAEPSGLRLDAGTEYADVHPEGGERSFGADGTLGTAYERGRAGEAPPCGVTCRRATHGGATYPLSATIDWSVTWSGTGAAWEQTLPIAALESTEEVSVEEVQTIVR